MMGFRGRSAGALAAWGAPYLPYSVVERRREAGRTALRLRGAVLALQFYASQNCAAHLRKFQLKLPA